MLKSDVEKYLAGWQAVNKVERQEARTATVQQRWRRLNAVYGLSVELGLDVRLGDQGEELVWQRWQLLRERM